MLPIEPGPEPMTRIASTPSWLCRLCSLTWHLCSISLRKVPSVAWGTYTVFSSRAWYLLRSFGSSEKWPSRENEAPAVPAGGVGTPGGIVPMKSSTWLAILNWCESSCTCCTHTVPWNCSTTSCGYWHQCADCQPRECAWNPCSSRAGCAASSDEQEATRYWRSISFLTLTSRAGVGAQLSFAQACCGVLHPRTH